MSAAKVRKMARLAAFSSAFDVSGSGIELLRALRRLAFEMDVQEARQRLADLVGQVES